MLPSSPAHHCGITCRARRIVDAHYSDGFAGRAGSWVDGTAPHRIRRTLIGRKSPPCQRDGRLSRPMAGSCFSGGPTALNGAVGSCIWTAFWESLGNQTPSTRRIGRYGLDSRTDLTCQNVIHENRVDNLQLIPKPCVAGSSPAGGASVMSQGIGDRAARNVRPGTVRGSSPMREGPGGETAKNRRRWAREAGGKRAWSNRGPRTGGRAAAATGKRRGTVARGGGGQGRGALAVPSISNEAKQRGVTLYRCGSDLCSWPVLLAPSALWRCCCGSNDQGPAALEAALALGLSDRLDRRQLLVGWWRCSEWWLPGRRQAGPKSETKVSAAFENGQLPEFQEELVTGHGASAAYNRLNHVLAGCKHFTPVAARSSAACRSGLGCRRRTTQCRRCS